MRDNEEKIKKKKTLSLKLGTKPLIAPKRNIEAGKTVIVEKKRYKKSTNTEIQSQKKELNESSAAIKKPISINKKSNNENRSGVVLKPLSKDEQKRILKADGKKQKKDEIEKIRSRDLNNQKEKEKSHSELDSNINFDNSDIRETKKESEKKKSHEIPHETDDKKKTQNSFGRKKN